MALVHLSKEERKQLKILEDELRKAVINADLKNAKKITHLIHLFFKPITNSETVLMKYKNILYETAIEAGEYGLAIDGLKSIKLKIGKNSRVYLETSTLLAIAFIRINNLKNAINEIKEVLATYDLIKSQEYREKFRELAINRFNEEIILFSMKGISNEKLNIEEIHDEAKKLLDDQSVVEIYKLLGASISKETINMVSRLDLYAKKQLRTAERLRLQSPKEEISEDELGETFFTSIRRLLYKSLCNPESEIYKAWFSDGLKVVLSKKYITTAVVTTLTGLGIGIKMIASSIVALILKFGIEVYCLRYKPSNILDIE